MIPFLKHTLCSTCYQRLANLAKSLTDPLVRFLPPNAAPIESLETQRQIKVLVNGLSARARRHAEIHGLGLIEKIILKRMLLKSLNNSGYHRDFSREAAISIISKV